MFFLWWVISILFSCVLYYINSYCMVISVYTLSLHLVLLYALFLAGILPVSHVTLWMWCWLIVSTSYYWITALQQLNGTKSITFP